MSDLLALESPELDTAAYLRSLAAEADGVEMLPGPRGNRLRAIADTVERDERARRVIVVAEPSTGNAWADAQERKRRAEHLGPV